MFYKFYRKKVFSSKITSPFSRVIQKYIDNNKKKIVFIDVGANRGSFFNELIDIFPNIKLEGLLIEPISESIEVLKEISHKHPNVTVINAALGDKIEQKDFFIYQYDETSSLLQIKNNLPELSNINTKQKEVTKLITTTMDIILADYKIGNNIDLLKLDVQGTEDKVILGSLHSLKRIEFIWIEVSFKPLYEGSCLFSEIYGILNSEGFKLLEITDGHRSPDKELLQANCLFGKVKDNSFCL